MNWKWKLVLPLTFATVLVGSAYANEDASQAYVAANAAIDAGDPQTIVLSAENQSTAAEATSKQTQQQLAECRQELQKKQTEQPAAARRETRPFPARRFMLGK